MLKAMWAICKKELRQFFGSLTGYLSLLLFLLLNGLFLFVFPDTGVFEFGYADMSRFFEISPWILLMLVPAITMRSFSDEMRSGTWEVLRTRPIGLSPLIAGKFAAAMAIVLSAVLPTLLYVYTISRLSAGGIDLGGIAGSYIGLLLLAATFAAVGTYCSAQTPNALAAFLMSAFACFTLFSAFGSLSTLASLPAGVGYYVELLGIEAHYRSVSRGVVDSRDLVYFLSLTSLFLFLTARKLSRP